MLHWMCTAMIIYGAVTWVDRVELSLTVRELDKLQRLGFVCIIGAMRSCLTTSSEVLLELTTFQMQARRLIFRMSGGTSETESCINWKKIAIFGVVSQIINTRFVKKIWNANQTGIPGDYDIDIRLNPVTDYLVFLRIPCGWESMRR